ncbi:hypothetical protein ACFWIJ_14935, partial [Streptomyces sp. NPDC127079]
SLSLSLRASRPGLRRSPLGAVRQRGAEGGSRVEIRAERLDWLPPVLASLDRPFVIDRPDELRDLVSALATRLASYARGTHGPTSTPPTGPPPEEPE